MSKAVNTLDPKYSKLTIGVCPDQWGVWFPEDPKQMDPRQAWQEIFRHYIFEPGEASEGHLPPHARHAQAPLDENRARALRGTILKRINR